MALPLGAAALAAARIIAAKRAKDIAIKKVAKVSAREARAVAREQMRSTSKARPVFQKRTTGLSKYEQQMVQKKQPITRWTSKELTGRKRSPEDIRRGRSIAEQEMRKKLSNPPKAKPAKPAKKEVFLTRGKNIAKRSEVEEVAQKRLQKQAKMKRAEEKFKKMTPEEKRTLMARAQVKRAQREEAAGKTKYGMDIKPRKELDDKVVERAKELTARERIELSRKRALEFEQRREADRRVEEGLKDILRRERQRRLGRGK